MGTEQEELGQIGLEFGEDLSDALIGQLLGDEVLGDIPWVGWIVKMARARRAISDIIFLRKLIAFFSAQSASHAEKEKFREKMMHKNELRRKVGEALLVHLDQLNDFDKPELTARVFDAFLAEKIDFAEFRKLTDAIGLGYIDDLRALGIQYELDLAHLRGLLRTGLVDVALEGTGSGMFDSDMIALPPLTFRLNALGHLFSAILRNDI